VITVAQHLNHWLSKHDIDPSKVTVVLRCNDARTKFRIDAAFKRELDGAALSYCADGTGRMPDMLSATGAKICGMPFLLKDLDQSR
jgi:hypothetical protein